MNNTVTLTLRSVTKSGKAIYELAGVAGSVAIRKSMLAGEAPKTLELATAREVFAPARDVKPRAAQPTAEEQASRAAAAQERATKAAARAAKLAEQAIRAQAAASPAAQAPATAPQPAAQAATSGPVAGAVADPALPAQADTRRARKAR